LSTTKKSVPLTARSASSKDAVSSTKYVEIATWALNDTYGVDPKILDPESAGTADCVLESCRQLVFWNGSFEVFDVMLLPAGIFPQRTEGLVSPRIPPWMREGGVFATGQPLLFCFDQTQDWKFRGTDVYESRRKGVANVRYTSLVRFVFVTVLQPKSQNGVKGVALCVRQFREA
jgi:hypothetical protein